MNSIYVQVDTKTTKWINTNSLHVSNTTIITYSVGYSEFQQWPLYSHWHKTKYIIYFVGTDIAAE